MKPERLLVLLVSLGTLAWYLAISGCSAVGPDYSPPRVAIPQKWATPSEGIFDTQREPVNNWWQLFNDPVLSKLIGDTIAGNRDLRKAVARIEEARAQFSYAMGGMYPSVDATGSVTRGKQSESINRLSNARTDYQTALESSWEIDLFGRIRRSVEAAKASFEATQEDYYYVLISTCAETAKNYFLLRATQAQLKAVQKNIESQREILEITKARFQAGLASELDVAQAEEVLALSEARIPPIRNTIDSLIHAIALLTGNYPGELDSLLREERIIELPSQVIPVGIPADLLRRRPDIKAAERNLAAATARVGIATADLYPTFSLTGTIGIEAIGTGDFMKASSSFYGLGPSLRWNIFDAGRIRSNIKAADARVEQALQAYEGTILTAIKEVEDGLVGYREAMAQVELLERSVEASKKVLDLAVSRYISGLVGFQTVLDAQRTLLDQETQLAQTKGNLATAIVNLYRALGGGWVKFG
ncbi:MAG: efflux transporter outer membrane subunit [Thermodesulforhabdaceae bacterium]